MNQITIDGKLYNLVPVESQAEATKKTFEQRFWELMLKTNRVEIDKEKYPDSTFGFLGENFLWEYNSKNGHLWLSHKLIWEILEKEFTYDYNGIQGSIQDEIEKHFNCKGVTPSRMFSREIIMIEKHFNCKGVTPDIK